MANPLQQNEFFIGSTICGNRRTTNVRPQQSSIFESQFTKSIIASKNDRNHNFQMSMTERVVTEAISDLNYALRIHQQSKITSTQINGVNDTSSTNRVVYQPNGVQIQFSPGICKLIPIISIKSNSHPYFLEIKDQVINAYFEEEDEVFLAYDQLRSYNFLMKMYIVEKGSQDMIIASADDLSTVFSRLEESSVSSLMTKCQGFCLSNDEKNQLNFIFLLPSSGLEQKVSKDISGENLSLTVQKYVKIARAYSFLGQPQMAVNYYNRIFNNPNIASSNLNEAEALEELMLFLTELNKLNEAQKNADRLIEIFSKSADQDKIQQILLHKGNLNIKAGDFASAQADYNQLLSLLQQCQPTHEITYLISVTYGKLAAIELIISNQTPKYLEYLSKKYALLNQILKESPQYRQSIKTNNQIVEQSEGSENQKSSINPSKDDQNQKQKSSERIENNLRSFERDEQGDQELLPLPSTQHASFKESRQSQQNYITGDDFESEIQQNVSIVEFEQEQIAIKGYIESIVESQSSPQSSDIQKNQGSFERASSIMRPTIFQFSERILKELIDVSFEIATAYSIDGNDIDFALNYYGKSIEFSEKLYGERSLEVALQYERVGLIRLENLDFDESEQAFSKSLKIKKNICCDVHPEIAYACCYLGCLHAKFHKYKQAKEYYLQALTILQHEYKNHKLELAETYNNIGNIYFNEKDIDSAVISYEKALDIFKQLSDEVPLMHFVQIYENIGVSLAQKSNQSESINSFKHAEEIALQILDENHPTLIRIRSWIKNSQIRSD